MELKTVITENSVWKFDTTLKRYIRFPKDESLDHPEIPYSADWDDYEELERNGDHILVIRPVPIGQGRLRMTGPVISDDLKI